MVKIKKLNNTKQQYIEHNKAVSHDTQSANSTAHEPKQWKEKKIFTYNIVKNLRYIT